MARRFGSYSPVVPLGLTWEEFLTLYEDDGVTPVNLTGYDVRAQFWPASVKNPVLAAGVPTSNPVFELTTADSYGTPPAWPVLEAYTFHEDDPLTGGIDQLVDKDDLWLASPTNVKVKLFFSMVLWNPDTNYAIPVVEGYGTFLAARTILPTL